MDKDRKYGLGTIPIHFGTEGKESEHHPVNAPVYLSSTFAFPTVAHGAAIFSGEDPNGFTYGRLANPTNVDTEHRLAALEGAEEAVLFGSGMAAVSTLTTTFLKAGDHVIADHTLYGGTHSVFTHVLPNMGIEVSMIDASKIENVKKEIKSNTKMIYFETPTNPTLRMVAIEPIVKLAKEHNILTAIDSTFMSPILLRPIEFGVDIVLHSATKYLNGHSDLIAGVVLGKKEHMDMVRMQRVHLGGMLAPFDAYLLGRGLKTLKIRVLQAQKNAIKVAEFLEKHPKIKTIRYLGLESHPDHELSMKQHKGPGSMMTFELNGSYDDAVKFVNSLKMITRAVSLGGVESLITHPASTTHSDLAVSPEDRKAAGITDTLMRMSVGIEDVEDIIYDLEQAFNSL